MTDSYLWGRDYTTGSYLHSGSDNLLGYIPANSDCFFFSCRELTCQETKHKEPHPPKGFSQWRIHPHLLPTWLPQANSILAVAQLLHLVVSSDSSSYSVIRNDFISHPPLSCYLGGATPIFSLLIDSAWTQNWQVDTGINAEVVDRPLYNMSLFAWGE